MDAWQDPARSPEARARDLCARLTLREKVGQLNQRLYGFRCYEKAGGDIRLTEAFIQEADRWQGLGALYGLYRADPWSNRDYATGLRGREALRACALAQRCVMERSRFGIPALMVSECPHGHQALDGYLLPVNLAQGAAFNPGLAARAAGVCARQLRQMGVHLALCSLLDVLRDPRWGRSEECFGEDPLLAARLAEGIVRAFQAEGVGVVAKHCCAQGETTGGVNASAARIGMREAREIHLPPVEAACRAGCTGVMAAYNEIDGVPCHANEALLNGILREEYGFRGLVMADGCALDRLDDMTGDNVRSGALALSAGVDMGLWDTAFSHLEEAVARGLVSQETLDRAVERVLRVKFALGLFEHPLPDESRPLADFTAGAHPESLQLAREGLVLLKNDGLLPLCARELRTVALIGPGADDLYRQLGDYTPPMRPERCATLAEGLRALLAGTGVALHVDDGADVPRAAALAARCDVALLALGGSSSRFAQVTFDVNGAALAASDAMDCGEGLDSARLRLPGRQHALFAAVRKAARRLATVIVAGRPYAIPDIAAATDALLYCFYPGPWGGQAVAEALLGRVSPAGRLPVSIPRHAGQLPVCYNAKRGAVPLAYADDAALRTPLFAFGDGFGYGRVVYAGMRLETAAQPFSLAEDGVVFTLRFTAENQGSHQDWAVPQLYVTDCAADVMPRQCQLADFAKAPLAPGERRAMTLTATRRALSVWNRRLALELQPGAFVLTLKDGGHEWWQGAAQLDAARENASNPAFSLLDG